LHGLIKLNGLALIWYNNSMQKETIKNRNGKNIVAVVNKAEKPKGLAFIMHGLGGFKEEPHIVTIGESFKEQGITIPRDACMTSPPRQKEGFLTSCEEGTQSERPFHLPIASKRYCVEASRCMSSRYS
jgi:hypothetical protein